MHEKVAADHIIFNHGPMERKGNENECLCSLDLPDDVFPSHMIDVLRDSHVNLTYIIDEEITRITKINEDILKYEDALKNVTEKIRDIEMNGIKDQTDFTNTKKAIEQLKTMVVTANNKLNGTDTKIEKLLKEVNNVSTIVWQLETFDQNNVLLVRREMAVLRKQLADCEEAASISNFGQPSPGLPGPEFGKCEDNILLNFSKPFAVKVNWKGFNNKYGTWGKDFAFENKNPNMYWLAPLNTDERLMESYRIYNSYSDLLLYKNHIEKTLSKFIGLTWNYADSGQGSGAIMYNGSLYYNCYNSRNLCKVDISTHQVKRKEVADATFNNWFSYIGVNWQDFDFAGDEHGLWVTYSTTKSSGKITIAKLDPDTLKILDTWDTSLFKNDTSNTFMMCGKLFALKRVSAHKEQLFYAYDTKTRKEHSLNIIMEKLSETPQSVSYNPNDHKIYMYNDGYLVTYDVLFRRLSPRDRRSVAREDGQNAIIPFNSRRQQFAVTV
ncbi:olfactomedin-like [Tiliqua scincoides]|uniref:olfactomedin-like n=1 Tax=Tiliqua scincoides TaxID=71010 RepID=UPI003461FA7C